MIAFSPLRSRGGFGPDGYLYIGMGDGGGAHDPNGNGQNRNVKLGKLLRIDVDEYPTPAPGNLQDADPDVFDYGLRNPWRFSFDRCTGDLYIGDVGQDTWEEIDVEPARSGHRDYGWDVFEASHCHEPARDCDGSGLVLPVVEIGHGPSCSVTGGYVYRGTRIPNLVGTYLYGDYCSGKIWYFTLDAGVVTKTGELTSDLVPRVVELPISSFGEDASGELYVVAYDGAVFRIDPE
jgi:glucose/arabinose dehydrogenase